MIEKWVSIKGYEGIYDISNKGRVKSLRRITVRKNGVNLSVREKIIKGSVNSLNYNTIELKKNGNRKFFLLHRLIYQAFIGELIKGMVIDHKDYDTLNNSPKNLQQITHRENLSKDQFRHNRSSNKIGVCKKGNKFESQIHIDGEEKYLGRFISEEEAAQAYQDKLIEINKK